MGSERRKASSPAREAAAGHCQSLLVASTLVATTLTGVGMRIGPAAAEGPSIADPKLRRRARAGRTHDTEIMFDRSFPRNRKSSA